MTTGGCERIGKARHTRMVERLGTGDPNYGRTKSRPERVGRWWLTFNLPAVRNERDRRIFEVSFRRNMQDGGKPAIGIDCAVSQSKREIRGEPQRKGHRGL